MSPMLCRSAAIPDLARWDSMELPGAAPSMLNGEPSRNGKWLLKSSGAEEKGPFIGADLGITSGRTGSRIEGEGDRCLAPGLGVLEGLVSSLLRGGSSSDPFLPLVDKS